MAGEDTFSLFGAGGLFSNGLFVGQLGLFALTLLLFAGALALCLMAMRAASSARQAHGAAIDLHASVERQASQMQLLGSDVERIAQDLSARHDEIAASMRAPAQSADQAPRTGAVFQSSNEPVRRSFENQNAELEDEPEKPSSLFRGLLRRR
ncbi:hypothetical protein [Hyphococcus sp.]|uniref:hypothetical protein n=1 Tax=Hyphococcus sp. TaxID=2038636 RepID=UPI002087BF46|nr:MAG: hypothetical protein DHS20C04_10570 [Marinicaulis sp.]